MYIRTYVCAYVHACLGVYMHVDVHVYTCDSGQYPLIRTSNACIWMQWERG